MTTSNPPPTESNQTPPLVTFTNFNPTKLTGVNYSVWLPQIVQHLKGGNIFGYVDGSTPCPPPSVTSTKDGVSTTSPNPAFLHWRMQDQLLLGAINSALSEKMLTHVTQCATSRDAWLTLETLFTSQTKARTMQVHYQLATLKKGSSSIADYYHTFQTLCDSLAVVGQPLNGFENVSFLLAGLGSDFDPFVTSITTRAEPLSVDEIYGHLLSHGNNIKHLLISLLPVLTLPPEATSIHTPLETTVACVIPVVIKLLAVASHLVIPGHFVEEAEDHLAVVSPPAAPSLADLCARSAIAMVILL